MPEFTSYDATSIVYDDQGRGPLVLLLHGFAASAQANWHRPGITARIVDAGFRVVSPDARGHGRSGKPHNPAAYANGAMVRDVRSLLDHLGVDEARCVGYSMGSLTTMGVCLVEPRVAAAVLGGVGLGGALQRARGQRGGDGIADALSAPDPTTVTNPVGRAFRTFAESTGADLRALAAVRRGRRERAGSGVADLAAKIRVPVLVVTGDRDNLVGSPVDLAQRIPGARAVIVTGDHLSAVNDPALATAIAEFLLRHR